ncbi:hypothetical protein CWC31_01955 [Pseudoalteromonas ruthenica]|uniref:hypothetical protein n=1 Tax=Pseudoalteromonas ruthenica TaxID=151081 RepID=UPI001107ADEC|nr:hypothetical protein [Pseudoalteromonas ruthenica]TLX52332.1 hypothetical protein CWC31_01955 [Pseudoalteromonas ruthenica]
MESKSGKYAFWGTILAAVISGAIGLYIHLDGQKETKEIAAKKAEAEKSRDTASVTISDVYIPPVNTIQDSSFFAKISNNSSNVAKDLTVKLNFGEASVSSCETIPNNIFKDQKDFETSIVSFSAGDILKRDSFYIYCLLSSPAFDSILVTGPNLFSSEKYTYKNLETTPKNDGSGFVTFFKVVATIVAVIFIGYFTIVILSLLNKKFQVE